MRVFETFAGTAAGVVHIGQHVDSMGLTDHRISAIHAFYNQAGDLVVLAGTYGDGLFRTGDRGRTWSPLTATATLSPFFSSLAILKAVSQGGG